MEKSVYQNTEISVNVDMILFQVMHFEQNLCPTVEENDFSDSNAYTRRTFNKHILL